MALQTYSGISELNSSSTSIFNYSVFSVTSWIYFSSFPSSGTNQAILFILHDGSWGYPHFGVQIGYDSTKCVTVYRSFSSSSLHCRATDNSLTSGVWYNIAVTYDGSNSANRPVIYINAESKNVTTVVSPSGNPGSLANHTSTFGTWSSGTVASTIKNITVHNVVLTPNEISNIYTSKGLYIPRRGLIFNPILNGITGKQSVDGYAIASSDKILDPISKLTYSPWSGEIGGKILADRNFVTVQ